MLPGKLNYVQLKIGADLYRIRNRTAIRFTANRTPIRTQIRIRVEGPLTGSLLQLFWKTERDVS
jgi:hypothetical protein